MIRANATSSPDAADATIAGRISRSTMALTQVQMLDTPIVMRRVRGNPTAPALVRSGGDRRGRACRQLHGSLPICQFSDAVVVPDGRAYFLMSPTAGKHRVSW